MTAVGRSFYLLLHTPVELARPMVLGVFRTDTYHNRLYADFVRRVEEERTKNGTQRYLMSKQEVQKWTPYMPAGLRAQLVRLDLLPHELDWPPTLAQKERDKDLE
jgi:hypothetical protein